MTTTTAAQPGIVVSTAIPAGDRPSGRWPGLATNHVEGLVR
jgi:hypothetical protein